jgi:hypothetical protein
MAGEILEEAGFILPPAFLPAVGVLLLVAGICLLLWSDLLVNLLAVLAGILAILLGLGFLAAGHLMGRGGIPPVLLFIAGFISILVGILAFLRRDIVFDIVIYAGALLAVLAGLLLLLIGSLLSGHGPWRRLFLWGGGGLLALGIALALFPAPASRLLLAAGGFIIAGAGAAVLLLSLPRRGGIAPRP